MSFYKELKRRNVFKVAVVYVIVGWLLLQISDTLVPALRLPEWFHSGVAFVLILGFPVALIFAWAYEMTPDGLKKDGGSVQKTSLAGKIHRKWDFAIIALLVIALGYFGWDKYYAAPDQDKTHTDAITQSVPQDSTPAVEPPPGKESIAVLPFFNMSSDPEQEYFSDGLSEELLNLLAKIPELRVISRSSAFAFNGEKIDIPVVAKKLNVAHVLEGSVRKSGNRIRITAQLIEAGSDSHIWSETYDRELNDIFAIQDEIAAAVVAQLKISLLGELPKAKQINPQAYALVLQAHHIYSTGGGEDILKTAEDLLRQALVIEPDYVRAMIELATVYSKPVVGPKY